MRKLLLTIAALACAGTAHAQQRRDPATVEVVYKVEGMDKVRVLADRRFTAADGQTLAYDAYLPDDGEIEPRAAIVFVGGAPSVRAWRWYQDHGRIAAAQRFVALIPDKRFPRGPEGAAQGIADTADFLRHVAANAKTLEIDPDRICLWVFSAGGRIAALPYRADAPAVDCLIGFYPILDGAAEAMADASARKVPAFVVRAGRDIDVINSGITRFAAAALSANQALTLINLPDADHGFEGLNDTEESRSAMQDAYTFMAKETGH